MKRQILWVLVVGLVGAQALAGEIDDAALADESNTSEWLAYGRTYSEQRFSPLAQINATNVSDLKVDWFLEIPELERLYPELVASGIELVGVSVDTDTSAVPGATDSKRQRVQNQ